MMYDYTCSYCKSPFQHRKLGKKYCSTKCYREAKKETQPEVTISCVICGTPFVKPWRWREHKTCSKDCLRQLVSQQKSHGTVDRTCTQCGKPMTIKKRFDAEHKFCSKDCFHTWERGGAPAEVELTCECCGKKFTKKYIESDRRFCSYSCANSGENNCMYGRTGELSPTYGREPWLKGLTKETDFRLVRMGEKISEIIAQKMVEGTWSPPHTGFRGEHFTSSKTGQSFYLRSSYESRYVRMLEEDPTVATYEYEPLRIPYLFEGSTHNYVPDFLVTYTDGRKRLVEVKPELLTDTPKNAAKSVVAQSWCHANDVQYVLVSESDLPTP